jgi:hypothetical protein
LEDIVGLNDQPIEPPTTLSLIARFKRISVAVF